MNTTLVNVTLYVASFYACDSLHSYNYNEFDPLWRHTNRGCKILEILQDMFKFKMVFESEDSSTECKIRIEEEILEQVQDVKTSELIVVVIKKGKGFNNAAIALVFSSLSYIGLDPEDNATIGKNGIPRFPYSDIIDVYVRPMNLRSELLHLIYPIHDAYQWRYGFVFRRSSKQIYRNFYSLPFTMPLWNCLYGMALFVTIIFYLLKIWERQIVGGSRTRISDELLVVIGGYCQHIPPLDPVLPSRRIAYFVFLIFAYIVYTYYASNLLSHLVNDKSLGVTLEMLAQSDIQLVMVDFMKLDNMASSTYSHNLSIIADKLKDLKIMTPLECLQQVTKGHYAILSDFDSLRVLIRRHVPIKDICSLTYLDLYSGINKYFFTSKQFAYKELFKMATMRATEHGLFKREIKLTMKSKICDYNQVVTDFQQIITPLIGMLALYLISVIIMFAERIHYKRTRVWPFVH